MNVNEEHTERLLSLLLNREKLLPEVRTSMNFMAEDFLSGLKNNAKDVTMHVLDFEKHTEEQFRTMIDQAGYEGTEGIREFVLENVMDGDLVEWYREGDPTNVIQYLAASQSLAAFFEGRLEEPELVEQGSGLGVLRKFREMDVIQKDDIQDQNLLYYSSRQNFDTLREELFNFLVDWDPGALKVPFLVLQDFDDVDEPPDPFLLLQSKVPTLRRGERGGHIRAAAPFKMVLKAGLRHFPHELGLLLQKDANNSTAIRAACWLWLVNWKLIVQCFEEMGNDKIFEKDPTTNLYPFMLAAADDSTPRLDLVYYLLRKDPEVLAPL
jgi:hypothetical protein